MKTFCFDPERKEVVVTFFFFFFFVVVVNRGAAKGKQSPITMDHVSLIALAFLGLVLYGLMLALLLVWTVDERQSAEHAMAMNNKLLDVQDVAGPSWLQDGQSVQFSLPLTRFTNEAKLDLLMLGSQSDSFIVRQLQNGYFSLQSTRFLTYLVAKEVQNEKGIRNGTVVLSLEQFPTESTIPSYARWTTSQITSSKPGKSFRNLKNVAYPQSAIMCLKRNNIKGMVFATLEQGPEQALQDIYLVLPSDQTL